MSFAESKQFKLGKTHSFIAFDGFKDALEHAKTEALQTRSLEEIKFVGVSKIVDADKSYFTFELTNDLSGLKNSLALISDQNTIVELIQNENEVVISDIESKMDNPYHSYVNTKGKLI